MAANIEGATTVVPGTYSQTETLQRGVSVPVGSRTAAIIGEGLKSETLVRSANGKGNDGFNSTYTSTKGADGRHFLLGSGTKVVAPVVLNRTKLFKNGIQLNVLEGTITSNTFDSRFNAKFDSETGQILLQPAYLVDLGGSFYSNGPANVGNGSINGLTLINTNAPAETWTIRCASVRRDSYGNPIDGYARFLARGSVSGTLLDGYGNQIAWQSNGTTVSNGTLSFSVTDGSVPFQEGDNFTVVVAGGALVAGESLTARYISIIDLDDPVFFTSLNDLVSKHGQPDVLTGRLSLGAQLAFSNATPGTWAVQAKPSVPRRVSYVLVTSADGGNTLDDLTFALPLNVTPDTNSGINFFVKDPRTGIETQILPNKVDFYDPTITADKGAAFITSYAYSYTVIEEPSVQKSAHDGYLTVTSPTTGTFTSSAVLFTLEDVGRSLHIKNSLNGNDGISYISNVSNDTITLTGTFGLSETAIDFEVLDSTAQSARIIFTQDLALSVGEGLRATVVDIKDADFYDAGWINAYEALEKIDTDIIVPLPSQTISAIFQNGKLHVESMSNIRNKKERVLFIGAIAGLTPDNVTGVKPAAVEDIGVLEGIQGDTVTEILSGNTEDLADYSVPNAYGDSFKVVYFYPDQINVQIGASITTVDGFFISAAAAGYLSGSYNISEPLTNKRLSGFSIDRSKLYAPIVQENIVNAGITLLQPVSGGGRIIWGKTTTISLAAEEQEISIVFIRDTISKAMRRAFLPYIGKAESATTKSTLFAVANSLMQSFIQQKLITTFSGVTVARDATEPRQWNVTATVQPVYGINWIYIRISVGQID